MNYRKPNDRYRGRNGYSECNYVPHDSPRETDVVEAQDFARFVIRELGSRFPSLSEMKSQVEAPDTVASVQERINNLKKEHHDEIVKLSAYHAQGFEDDDLEQYMEFDDLKYFADLPKGDEWEEHYSRLESLFRRSEGIQTSASNNFLEQEHYDHLHQLLPLLKRRTELQRLEEAARVNRAAQFPQTVHEYRSLQFDKAAQLRVARFLMADEIKRRQMRDESRWTTQRTEPLIKEYNSNHEFRRMVENLVRQNESRDPRSRQT